MAIITAGIKNFAKFTKSVSPFLERVFPALCHWLRLPGLLGWCAASIGAGLALLLPFRILSIEGPHATAKVLSILAIAALLAAGVLARSRAIRFAAFLLFAAVLCTYHRARQAEVFDCLREAMSSAESMTITGKVTSPPLPYYENFHFRLKIDSVEGIPSKDKLSGITLDCSCPVEPPQYGPVVVRGSLRLPRVRKNPFEYDEYKSMMANGIWGFFSAASCEVLPARPSPFERLGVAFRGVTVAALQKIDDFDNRALLQASFLGDTEFLSPYIKDVFRKSGTYHLIAISGLNTAMLTAALYFFLGLFPIGRTARHLVCLAALWAYLPFVGMQPSLFRATVMATGVIAALLFEKKNYALHTLGLAGILWLALSPESLCGPGYQLSFAATAGLLTLFPVLFRFRPKPKNPVARHVATFLFSSLYISLASFLATAPILLYHFGTISYFGLMANLVAVTAMTFAMWAFFAGLFFQMVLPFVASLPLWASERFLDVVVGVGKWAGFFSWSQVSYPVPFPEMIVLFALFLVGLAAVGREHLKAYLFCGCAAAALLAPADLLLHHRPGLTAVRFAIPKTEAVGIRWPDDRVWIIVADANQALPRAIEQHILPWVRHAGGNRVDALFVPENRLADMAADAATLPALASASISAFPFTDRNARRRPPPAHGVEENERRDSLVALPLRTPRCACTIVRDKNGLGVKIAALGHDTTLLLTAQRARGLHRADEEDAAEETPRGAEIMTFRAQGIRTAALVQADHPAR